MTTLRVNTKGLTDPVVSEYIQKDFKIIFQQLEKTLNNKGAKTITVNFQSDLKVGGQDVAAVVSGTTANKVITFDAGIALQNESLVNTEFQKKTFSTFSHELLHIAYPNLASNGAVHNSHDYQNASMSDLAAELSFKAATLHNINKLGGYYDSFEADDFRRVAGLLKDMENGLSSDKKTGIDFSVTKPDGTLDPAAVDRIFNELTDSSSKLHGLLPPAAKNTQYSEAFDAPDIGDEVISEWMDENGDLGVCRSVWTGDEFLDFFDWMDDGFDDPPCDEDPLEPIPMEDWWPDFPWPAWLDPLALDLDGDGLELVALSQSSASFDLDGDGFRQATAWLKGDDGFLAWDKDGNGKISDISELFGSETADGYTVLAAHDSNGDGKIDANDAIFSKLSIWRDLNGNGSTDAGELKSLGEMGILSISLAKTTSNIAVDGSRIAFTGTFTRTDGSTGQSGALFFETNNARSEWIAPEGFEVSTEAGLLPNVRGHGDLPDLAAAMTLDSVLLQMVTDFVMACGTLSVEDMRAALTNILFQWAGVQSVASDGRGSYVDGQHLAFVEMFYGQPYIVARNGTLISSDPQDQRNGNIIENSFNDLVNGLLARVLSGVPFAQFLLGVDLDAIYANPLYPLIKLKYSVEIDGFSGDFDATMAFIHQRAPEDMAEKAHYYDTVLKVLDSVRLDYFENNKQAFHEAVIRSVQELDGISQALVQASLDFAHRIHEGVDANDTLAGGSTVDIMFGNAGNDMLQGGSGNDILIGGKGNDTLYGGSGSDTYVFNLGDGQDVFDEVESGSSGDVVLFGEGIRPEDIVVTQGNGGRDLILSIRGTTDQVTLKNVISMAYAWARIEFIRFADGTQWTYQQAWEKSAVSTDGNDVLYGDEYANTMTGGAGSDTLYGRDGNDTLIGGKGNDTLYGGGGGDTYVFNLGDGQDVFDEVESGSAGDTVLFGEGIRPEDIIVAQGNGGRDLVLSIRGTTDQVTLKNVISTAYAWARIEFVRFADGTEWTYTQMLKMLSTGTDGNDVLYGDEQANVLNGVDGNDTLYGRGGNDILIGGKGNDTLYGGGGSDTYVFELGDGQDVFDEQDMGSAGDAVLFGEGIHPEDIIVTQGNGGRDLILSIRGTTDQVTLKNVISMAYAWARIEFIRFADGTEWTYQQTWEKSVVPTDGNDTFYGDELANTMTGGAGSDTLYGRDGNDILIGGKGNDTLYGGGGSDTYVFNLGDGQDIFDEQDMGSAGDAVLFGEGIHPEDIIVTQGNGGRDLILSIRGTTDQVTLKNVISMAYAWARIEFIRFADGTQWTYQQAWEKSAVSTDGNDVLYGDELANTMTGGAGNDTLYGRDGNDILIGGEGNDTLYGGGGGDTYVFNLGDGQDVFDEQDMGSAGDAVLFGEGIHPEDIIVTQGNGGRDLILSIRGTTDQVTLKNVISMAYAWARIEFIRFADGTQWTYQQAWEKSAVPTDGNDTLYGDELANTMTGGAGNDTLYGRDGNDILIGGKGNDTLYGNSGGDTYVFNRGDSQDIIDEQDAGSAGDAVLFGEDVRPEDIIVTQGNGGRDLILSISGTSDQVTLKNVITSSYAWSRVEFVRFADGTEWTYQQALEKSITPTDGNDTLYGDEFANTMTGGAGNDMLYGRAGNDTFVFKPGFGHDTIGDFTAGAGIGDVVEFDQALFDDFQDVLAHAQQVGSDVVITYDTNNDLRLKNVKLANLNADDFHFVG